MVKIPWLHNVIGRGVLFLFDNLIPSSIEDLARPISLKRKNIIFLDKFVSMNLLNTRKNK